MKIFFDSLGCPKALVDAEKMSFLLEKDGHLLVNSTEEAEAIVVNTCGFIGAAKKENIETILNYAELKKDKPNLKLIVSGCLSERYKEELLKAIPEIDASIGVKDFTKIINALNESNKENLLDDGEERNDAFFPERSLNFSGLNYAYLKISEGCNKRCSFCAIPAIRGKQRSRTIENILKEAEFLLSRGINELILIAEDSSSYGMDIYGKKKLIELLKELNSIGFDWIRVMYLYPDESILSTVETISSLKNVCNYIDIPLQHVNKDVLKSMNREGDLESYLSLIEKIREINPDISIRSSFIIGYPIESEVAFNELKFFLKEAKLNRVGFFEYSREEGTPSYSLKSCVSKEIVKNRLKEITQIQNEVSKDLLKKHIGKKLKCIFDGSISDEEGEILIFRTEYDAPEIDGVVKVVNKYDKLIENAFEKIEIVDSDEIDLIGKLNEF
ncbi:MAG: 30S ribosomal protein S12 methylthiotransferase RimO [Brevinematales bacterium]|nr:30S ribosomal protein S12 methylthiotransferase RimO [Brevinematales bacterium]